MRRHPSCKDLQLICGRDIMNQKLNNLICGRDIMNQKLNDLNISKLLNIRKHPSCKDLQ